ncbi:hypothetical protein Pmar_PMAR021841 [Perkinsus marinus ATCC 50983]|uniref:Uncharacterized protein n=1 Tax=Perkinsus marinus (strain ATCC 50983 / TXsc) TaxID=423536 RepID=C5LG79_PERM5|nr:hypothetical protein Pmar_PMAR021841 [Perkinsus marinus ATCC 50983]EER04334.1 hypothetical protein Pmar_PMAR021841 [Perkinsus marinus ATCC 50983]|eukprot:XP_002772518.1 hypothetical protein Pmar_PMAR021841 [Perkinsus marinus ATCC 50983]
MQQQLHLQGLLQVGGSNTTRTEKSTHNENGNEQRVEAEIIQRPGDALAYFYYQHCSR